MSRVLHVAGRVALVLLVLLFSATVWPTLYRYEHTGGWPHYGPLLVRVNRVTGNADVLVPGEPFEWRRVPSPPR